MKKVINIENYEKKTVFAKLQQFCGFAKEDDFIEITEWANAEGFDVDINGRKIERFQLTWGEFSAIKKLVKELDKL